MLHSAKLEGDDFMNETVTEDVVDTATQASLAEVFTPSAINFEPSDMPEWICDAENS